MITMEVNTAIQIVNNELVYKPGWTFTATDHTKRFECCISIRVEYPANETNRDRAKLGYPDETRPYATFPLVVRDISDTAELVGAMLDIIAIIDSHEAREYMRVKPTYWAPFHPHRIEGMERWQKRHNHADVSKDLQFGIS